MTIIYLNLALNICSLLLMMITLYGVLFVENKKSTRNTLFKWLVGTLLFCLLVDTSSYYFVFTNPGGTGWYIMSFIAAIPPFIWVTLVLFYLISFIREKKPVSWNLGWIYAAAVFVCICVGTVYALRGEAFTWEDNHFQPGFMGYIVFFLMLFMLLYYGSMIFIFRKILGKHNSIVLFMYLFIPMTGLTLDALIPGLYSILFGMAVSVQICFTLVQHHELNLARQQAESASNAKSLFLHNMSHDIRTPMNAILGFAELMERQANNPEVVINYLQKIKSSGNYLLTLINNVLDMARIESGKAELDEECFDMFEPNSQVVPFFEDMMRKKNLTLTTKHHIEHKYVMLDKVKLQQILINLISNAVKYTPDGGHITISLMEQPCDRDGFVRFEIKVQDDGIGMSKEFAEHIFDHFSRERNTTDAKIVGTGLGMSIVKKLVELMGGTIEVETEQGKGTTFTVLLEFAQVLHPEEYIKAEENKPRVTVSLEGKRILLAEDNELNAEIATLILEEAGLLIEHAVDGVECVRMLSDSPAGYYDLILMDVQMPNLNGFDATRQIRMLADKVKAEIPIIAVTANAFEEDRQLALQSGMNGHLAKPIVVDKLIEKMSELLTPNS